MKIIIIASGFTGATLPLANSLVRKGCEVVFYNFRQWDVTFIESIDLDIPKRIPTGSPELLSKSNRLYTYLDKTVDFYFLPFWKRRGKLEKLFIGKIFSWLNTKLYINYAKAIFDEKADYINVIVYSYHDVILARAIWEAGIPMCITYHEVLQGLVGEEKLKPTVAETIKYGTPIIVHSHNTAKKLINVSCDPSIEKRIHIINFGAFESYLSYGKGNTPNELPKRYLLYIGHVHPYKGLKYLYEAVEIIDNRLDDVKIIVAGDGFDPIIKKMKTNPRFMVFNHFIANAELVGFIRHCQAIVCPYIAASQSGLVQTAMVWGKPVIATRVGAFTEVIRDGENGLLCQPSNSKSLADAIERFLNIKCSFHVSCVPDNLNWDVIADKYIKLFSSIRS